MTQSLGHPDVHEVVRESGDDFHRTLTPFIGAGLSTD